MNPLEPSVVVSALTGAIVALAGIIFKLQADALTNAKSECKEWKAAAETNGRTADDALRVSRAMSDTLDRVADRLERLERRESERGERGDRGDRGGGGAGR